jgi:hypothetical protein
MAANLNRVTVRGSERTFLFGARAIGLIPNDERFEVTVRVRRRTTLQSLAGAEQRIQHKVQHQGGPCSVERSGVAALIANRMWL